MVMEPKPFKAGRVESAVFVRVGVPMSVVRVQFPPRIVEAGLMGWEPGIPGIWYRYHDGVHVISDATFDSHEIRAAIKILSPEDRDELSKSLEAYRAVARPFR